LLPNRTDKNQRLAWWHTAIGNNRQR
jgi:hypothetical protein